MALNYERIASIEHPHFRGVHHLLQTIFPAEEVLAYELWREPLEDPAIHVYAALHGSEVVGATEYRYYTDLCVAMTDFTIIGKSGLGIGRFLFREREKDLRQLALQSGTEPLGMFAEVYDAERAGNYSFGGVSPMNPYVRREVLSHMGYKRLDMRYVHPSWDHEGKAVEELDLCFLPSEEELETIDSSLVHRFLDRYYTALPHKPKEWLSMMEQLQSRGKLELLPL
ncbi:GNAT family N-acetyltransferase [Paenibacillus sp. HB172176]|uniref:GNAT family N-acetyltransferase n=1 Tax=Paenibacillus sp. HB172176 TaxID=2493690 RepID=UPI001438EB32|nr:GNAT family N-acetyltransferase [Paenibacillus sp. HB172176]